MTRIWTAFSLVTLVTASVVSAQRTWVVDAKGGLGSQFKSIQLAVDAAKAGDILLVRPGNYNPFTVSKGLRILGSPGSIVWSAFRQPIPIHVKTLPAAESLTISGMQTVIFPGLSSIVQVGVFDCKGTVLLEGISCSGGSITFGAPGVVINNSKSVILDRCQVGFGLQAISSTLSASDCSFARYRHAASSATQSAITLDRSDAVFSSCAAQGESGPSPVSATPALSATRSSVSIRGRSSFAAGNITGAQSEAVLGDAQSSLSLDPRVTLTPTGTAKATRGFAKVTKATLPSLDSGPAQLGKSLALEMLGARGDHYVLKVSPPAVPMEVALFGKRWTNPAATVIVAIGVHTTGSTKLTIPVPNQPSLRGLSVVWQTFAGPWPRLLYSNPAISTLH